MSTEGAGKCCLTAGAPLIAAIGASVLIGDQIIAGAIRVEGWSKEGIKEQERLREKVAQEVFSHGSTVDYLSSQMESMAVAQAYKDVNPSPRISKVEQQSIQETIARMRMAAADASASRQTAAERERGKLQHTLRTEIMAGKGLLPKAAIREAEEALEASDSLIFQMIYRLQSMRQQAEDSLSRQDRERQQTNQQLALLTARLRVIEQMLQEINEEQQAPFVERQRAIQSLVVPVDTLLDNQPQEALALATQAQESASALSETVSRSMVDAWSTMNSKLNQQLGIQKELLDILNRVGQGGIIDKRVIRDLTQRVMDVYNGTQALTQQPVRSIQSLLPALVQRTDKLKQEVFAVVEAFQQRIVAGTIEETLTELGFGAPGSSKRLVHENGDMIRIVASPPGTPSQTQRDDRVVSFDISRNGDVGYDFVGYVGDSCVNEAEKLFGAFQKKGLYILEPGVAERLQESAARGQPFTPEMLNRPELQAHPVKNKLQAELAERVWGALERMKFDNMMQQVVGGCIEMEAFNGSLGYRVVVNPDGSLRVFKDDGMAEVDIALDTSDPIVAEAQQVSDKQVHKQAQAKKRQQPSASRQRQNLQH